MIVSEQYQERFQKILNEIQLNPNNFDMGNWYNAYVFDEASVFDNDLKDLLPQDEPECGTTLCIAGWAAHHAGYKLSWDGISACADTWAGQASMTIPQVAKEYLGLDDQESMWLFTRSNTEALETLGELAKGGRILNGGLGRGFYVEMPGDTNG